MEPMGEAAELLESATGPGGAVAPRRAVAVRVAAWATAVVATAGALAVAGVARRGLVNVSSFGGTTDLFLYGWMEQTGSICDKINCTACASLSGCRWCPRDQKCESAEIAASVCSTPITSAAQCWEQYCAYEMEEFLNPRRFDAKAWVDQTTWAQVRPLHPFRTYKTALGVSGMFDLSTGRSLWNASEGSPVPATGFTIAALSDWGTGTCVARAVARLAAATNPEMTLHLGDVYYTGTIDQYMTNFAGAPRNIWLQGVSFPTGRVTTFALAGNHDLISGFGGLYMTGFARTGQRATYACWQTDTWRIVALDTGRLSYLTSSDGTRDIFAGETDAPIPQEVLHWLWSVVNLGDPKDKRGIMILSHHPPYDAFGPSYDGLARQLDGLLPAGREVVWFFGHHHHLVLYDKLKLDGLDFVIHPRLIGIGGFPGLVLEAPKRKEGLIAYDARTYQTMADLDGVSRKVGFNGFAKMRMFEDQVNVDYITADCVDGDCAQGLSDTQSTVVAQESLVPDLSTGKLRQEWSYLGPELTKVNQPSATPVEVEGKREAEFGQQYDASLHHYD